MSYLSAKSVNKKPSYLATFLPIVFIGYVATMGSANATESTGIDSVSKPLIIKSLQSGFEVKSFRGGWRDLGRLSEQRLNSASTKWIMMDPPEPSATVTFKDNVTGKEITKAWTQLSNAEILRLLPNTTTEVTIGKVDAGGNVNYLTANATGAAGNYKIIMDYTPYTVKDFMDEANRKIGKAKVGIGLRLTANITTYRANIDLGSLTALGAAANANRLKGQMRIDTIGVRLKDDSGIMLSNMAINERSIAENLNTLAILQSRIADEDTTLVPQVIWVKPNLSDETIPTRLSFWDRVFNK